MFTRSSLSLYIRKEEEKKQKFAPEKQTPIKRKQNVEISDIYTRLGSSIYTLNEQTALLSLCTMKSDKNTKTQSISSTCPKENTKSQKNSRCLERAMTRQIEENQSISR